jgi:1-acyl-sn-glycerol-3-phosphate acyltransferase
LAHPTTHPLPPPFFQQDRGWLLRSLGRLYLRLGGWTIEGGFPADAKYVVIVAPHTSNWDFVLGVAVVFALELRASWLGKHSLFKAPFGPIFRWLGGIPVNRSASHGVVGECAKAFDEAQTLLLALAPEGTRKGVSQWKTGFYRIAVQAGVPIMPVGFDYGGHSVHLMPLFTPSGDLDLDLPRIQALFNRVHGRRERPREP